MRIYLITTALVIVFFSVFLLLPISKIIWIGLFETPGSFNFFTDLLPPFIFTYLQAFLSSLIAMFIGVGLALFYTEFDFPWKKILWRLSTLSFSMPVTLLVMALVGVWGKQGLLGAFFFENGFYGWPAILMAHSFFNYPLFFKLSVNSILGAGRNEEKCALVLGCSRWQSFWRVSLWKMKGALSTAFMLSMLYSASSLVVLLLLGGGPRFSSLEVLIYQAVKVELDLGQAAVFSALQLIVCVVIQLWSGRNPILKLVSIGDFKPHLALYRFEKTWANRLLVWMVSLFFGVFVVLPLLQLAGTGVGSIHSLEWAPVISGVFQSLYLACRVALISVVVGLLAVYSFKHLGKSLLSKVLLLFSQLPLAISPVILGLGLFICYPNWIQSLREGIWGIIIVQVLLSLPLVFQTLGEGFSRIDQNLYLQARSLGASEIFILRGVELPVLRSSIILSLLLSLGLSLGETGSLLLFESQGLNLLSLSIYKAMGSYRFVEASGISFVLLMLMGFLFWMVGKWEN